MTQSLPVPLDVKLMNLTATLLLLGFVLLGLGTGGRWLANHPVFAIRGLTVLGDISHTSALTLRAHVGPQLSGTFLTVDLNAVRQAFETVPWVRRAVVQREFPNRLRVILQEHQAVAYWGEELALSERGNWHLQLASGAGIELGSGDTQGITNRARQFLGTVGQVAIHHGRKLDALEMADLRYAQGYALRLRGVSTVAQDQGKRH